MTRAGFIVEDDEAFFTYEVENSNL